MEGGKHSTTGSVSRNDYEMETEASKLQVERERDPNVEKELRQADKEAEEMNVQQEKEDVEYKPKKRAE